MCRRADAAGEPSAEGRHGQDGEGEGPGGGEPASQVGSGHSAGMIRVLSRDLKLVLAISSPKQANGKEGNIGEFFFVRLPSNEGQTLPPCG